MSQLKKINGRYYQEAEVVMLSTKDKSLLHVHSELLTGSEQSGWSKELEITTTNIKFGDEGWYENTPQHLYIIFNEKIKESDWYIWLDNNQIYRAVTDIMIINQHVKNGHIKKIIATTNEYIGYTDIRVSPVKNFCTYPQPSDSFIKKYIEEYNKGNVITKVLVEYEEYRSMLGLDIDDNTKINYSEPWYELKVDSNNTITIKRLELELYTREEVKILITNAFKAGYERRHSGYPYTDNWSKPKVEEFLKENL